MQDVVEDLTHWPPRSAVASAPEEPPPAPAASAPEPESEPEPASGLRWRRGGR